METGHQKLAQEKEFYQDLDQQKTHTFCSCQALILIFAIMIIISVGISYYAVTSLQHLNTSSFSIKRLSFHKNTSNKADTITLYQSDLQSKVSGIMGNLIPLKNKQILIKPEGLILKGETTNPPQKLSFIADPVVKNQKIALENIRLENNSSSLSGKFSNLIYTQISKGVAISINSLISFNVSDIQLKDGEMILTVY